MFHYLINAYFILRFNIHVLSILAESIKLPLGEKDKDMIHACIPLWPCISHTDECNARLRHHPTLFCLAKRQKRRPVNEQKWNPWYRWSSITMVTLFGVFGHSKLLQYIIYIKLPVKGCNFFLSTLGTHVRVVWSPPTVTREFCLLLSSPRTPDTYTCCRSLSSGAVTTCFNCRGHDSTTKPSACEANALSDCATAAVGEIEL